MKFLNILIPLERLKKYCSHSASETERAVFLVFGFVSTQSQGFTNLLLRRSLAKPQKSSLRIGYSIFLTALALLTIGVGCQSDNGRTVSQASATTTRITESAAPQPAAEPVAMTPAEPKPTSVQQIVTDKATYTIETIPNTRLTPTSREGDKPDRVYSSNIIAVYVRTNSGVTVTSTNAVAVPISNISQPEHK
jgi:hypothetical protein